MWIPWIHRKVIGVLRKHKKPGTRKWVEAPHVGKELQDVNIWAAKEFGIISKVRVMWDGELTLRLYREGTAEYPQGVAFHLPLGTTDKLILRPRRNMRLINPKEAIEAWKCRKLSAEAIERWDAQYLPLFDRLRDAERNGKYKPLL
jgi:hypothetical protein